MRPPPRIVSLLLLLALFGLPGLPGAGAIVEKACASACGKKCCCRPARGGAGCAMRASCCGTPLPSDSATTPMPKGKPVERAALAAPGRTARALLGPVTARRLHDLPSPPDPPPRSAC